MSAPANPAIDLPLSGIAALDASAGTGKTYSIALLHLRLVLSGVPVDRILVSTFTNDAAAELRERLRQRLIEARRVCSPTHRTTSFTPDDPNLQIVLDAARTTTDDATLQARLDDALSCFDLAPICTIHSFCQRLLRDYALELGAAPNTELQAQDPVLARLVDDFRATAQWHDAPLPIKSVRDLRQLAQAVRDLQLIPGDDSPTDPAAAHQAWWQAVLDTFRAWQTAWQAHGTAALDALQAAESNGWIKAKTWTPAKRKNTEGIANELAAFDLNAVDTETILSEGKAITQKTGFSRLCWTDITHTFAPGHTHDAEAALQEFSLFALSDKLRHQLGNRDAYLRAAACQRFIHYIGQVSASEALTFADLIQTVYRQLANHEFVAAVRADFDAVLVDECQDTDPQQIAIFNRLFGGDDFAGQPNKCLIWVGDPKQSIYRFRGADLETYLAVKETANAHTLAANFRSDPPLVAAVNALFSGPADDGINVFDKRIPFLPAHARQPVRLRTPARDCAPPAFCVHTWPFTDPLPAKGTALRHALTDCADQIVALLQSSLEVAQPASGTDDDLQWRGVQPGDVAVLGRTHPELEMLRRLLLRRGIPAAYQTNASIYREPEARDLSVVLSALAQPRPDTLRAALTTPLFGYPLAAAADCNAAESLAEYTRHFADWARRIEQEGVLAVVFAMLRDARTGYGHVPALTRLAGEPGGERTVTNIIQLGECLQNVWRTQHARGAEALKDFLDHAIAQAAEGTEPSAEASTTLRLETDRPTVILSTIHAAKGLQYPIVFLPSLWLERSGPTKEPPAIITYAANGQPTLHLPGDPEWDDVSAAEKQQYRAEQMRLIYVALTRAKHQVHAWWGPAEPRNHVPSLLGTFARLLYDPHRNAPPTNDAELHAALETALSRDPATTFTIRQTPDAQTQNLKPKTQNPSEAAAAADNPPPTTGQQTLAAAAWTRAPLTDGPYQASYSALVRKVAADYKGADEYVDEPVTTDPVRDEPTADSSPIVPGNRILDGWPAGRVLGDRVHAAFEEGLLPDNTVSGQARFTAALVRDLPALAQGSEPIDQLPDPQTTAEALWTATTQAQWWPDGPRLHDLFDHPRAPEWTYLLPQSGAFSPASLAATLHAHRGPHPWGDSAYIERVAHLDFPAASGYFEGIIDVFGQLPDGRWALVDYKTNWIETGYAPDALADAMAHSHYLLQALLYTVAAQRWLRQTQAHWQYDRDFAGTTYLFLRGVQADTTHGVWFARPPRTLVDALEHTLCGGATPT